MKMVSVSSAFLLVVLVSQARCDPVCLAPQSETVFYRTQTMENLYVAQDFNLGQILHVFNSVDGQGDNWSLVDIKNRMTYVNLEGSGCHYIAHKEPFESRLGYDIYDRCLPGDAKLERSGLVDFYYMERLNYGGVTWLIGLKPVLGTDYQYM
ncbi:hypothetical protein ElyMa_001005700 [Elysia marginata]|uniref:Fibrinogen C-terminal domain-containing protein n=1 Tax=Elysia marginata TaxID=1093978 RepID=A0AAV4HI81_9GAST|nr:hypothetical protein ElyMa_001005700 [Elysia marginata]